MHNLLSFNHRIASASEIFLPALSEAALYGSGIFTTVAIYNSKPFQWENHWRRIIENAKAIGIDLSDFTEERVRNSLSEIIESNNFKTGRARLTFFNESAKGIWQIENGRRTSLLITSANFRPISNNLRLTVSPYPVNSKSPLINVKSCNYLENLLILKKVGEGGFDEAIRLNEKSEIVSAVMANVFWTANGKIFTPATETGALGGTTRDFILKSFSVCEKRAVLDELRNADEIFLSSAGIGVARAESLENKIFKRSDVFARVRKFFDEFTGEMS